MHIKKCKIWSGEQSTTKRKVDDAKSDTVTVKKMNYTDLGDEPLILKPSGPTVLHRRITLKCLHFYTPTQPVESMAGFISTPATCRLICDNQCSSNLILSVQRA